MEDFGAEIREAEVEEHLRRLIGRLRSLFAA
jgi:hypothetical protein